MTDHILQAYREVEMAMERYTLLLDEHVTALQTSKPVDLERLERMTHGARAMRDSSLIYLSYAKYIASGMPESPDLVEDDLQG
ncbi:MAG: hypothetical protein R3B11_05360 [Nitrospira sp.]|jgi:hypothetical protein|nr:hypothetical protein [Nitrospira sp.]MCW5785952.1 hypothetical protein [Nitrospira sp.]MDR4475423.1 hypothetical protein [Nitrospira sp.]HAP40674.1 hypothetical protein [Nitrospira sp.]